jgi:hypothetical protein
MQVEQLQIGELYKLKNPKLVRVDDRGSNYRDHKIFFNILAKLEDLNISENTLLLLVFYSKLKQHTKDTAKCYFLYKNMIFFTFAHNILPHRQQ